MKCVDMMHFITVNVVSVCSCIVCEMTINSEFSYTCGLVLNSHSNNNEEPSPVGDARATFKVQRLDLGVEKILQEGAKHHL